ncbi:MAG: DUF3567 family protein [Burkholderiaceae bacterium]|nr:DUF3567 family protein [Burkholderiaceae bacterium]
MQMIYNSPNYCVVEFADSEEGHAGFEIMDKTSRREIYINGALALRFRQNVSELIASEPTSDEVDAFLSGFGGLMQQPLTLH